MEKDKGDHLEPIITKIPLPASDSAMVIDLPDGQKLVVGKMTHGTVIEVATWRGTGRPDSRTNRMMLGLSSSEAEAEEKIRREGVEKQATPDTYLKKSLLIGKKILVWLFVPKKSQNQENDQDSSSKEKFATRIFPRFNGKFKKNFVSQLLKLRRKQIEDTSTFSSDQEFEAILASIERKAGLASSRKKATANAPVKKSRTTSKNPQKKSGSKKKSR